MSYYDLTGNMRIVPEMNRCTCKKCRIEELERKRNLPEKNFGCSTIFWAAIIISVVLTIADKFI